MEGRVSAPALFIVPLAAQRKSDGFIPAIVSQGANPFTGGCLYAIMIPREAAREDRNGMSLSGVSL
jgi:hypothetical protein